MSHVCGDASRGPVNDEYPYIRDDMEKRETRTRLEESILHG